MLIWDKDREDWGGFTPNPSAGIRPNSYSHSKESSSRSEKNAPVSREDPAGKGDLLVTRPVGGTDKKGVSLSKFNPVSHWRVSKKAIKGKYIFPL